MTCIAELDSDFFFLIIIPFICNFSFCVGCSRRGLYDGAAAVWSFKADRMYRSGFQRVNSQHGVDDIQNMEYVPKFRARIGAGKPPTYRPAQC